MKSTNNAASNDVGLFPHCDEETHSFFSLGCDCAYRCGRVHSESGKRPPIRRFNVFQVICHTEVD